MPIFQARELLQLPDNPNNATDTVINGIHFNRTALDFFNYTLYSNGTLSNWTNCWLTFDIYRPHMLPNGTFLNATSCYSPIKGISQRGGVGIAFASLQNPGARQRSPPSSQAPTLRRRTSASA